MSKRITISIPDDLGVRLAAAKGQIRVSRTCARALKTEVEMIETRNKASNAIESLIQQREARVYAELGDAEQEGRRAFLAWINETKDPDLEFVEAMVDTGRDINQFGQPLNDAVFLDIGELLGADADPAKADAFSHGVCIEAARWWEEHIGDD